MYLDFRNASILKRGKFPFSAPVRKNLLCFKMVGEWLNVLSPFCEMSLFWLLMVILSQETMSVFVGNNNRMSSSWKIPGI